MFQEPPELETLTEKMVPEEPDMGTLLPVPFPLALAVLLWVCLSQLCEDTPLQQHFLACHHIQRVQLFPGQVQPAESAVALWNWPACALCSVYATGHWFSLPAISFQCPRTAGHTHRVSQISFQGQSPSAGVFVLF